jgi:hypothetical protein
MNPPDLPPDDDFVPQTDHRRLFTPIGYAAPQKGDPTIEVRNEGIAVGLCGKPLLPVSPVAVPRLASAFEKVLFGGGAEACVYPNGEMATTPTEQRPEWLALSASQGGLMVTLSQKRNDTVSSLTMGSDNAFSMMLQLSDVGRLLASQSPAEIAQEAGGVLVHSSARAIELRNSPALNPPSLEEELRHAEHNLLGREGPSLPS